MLVSFPSEKCLICNVRYVTVASFAWSCFQHRSMAASGFLVLLAVSVLCFLMLSLFV